MKYLNTSGLPKSVHKWLTTDEYFKAGDISVTGLLEPPRIRVLEEKYDDLLHEENITQYKNRRGTAIHDSIEKANKDDKDLLQECIFYVDILGWKIKGQFDEYRISTATLTDFKTTGPYQFDQKYDTTLEKWETQLNIYNYMIKQNTDYVPKKLQVVAFVPDEPRKYRSFVPKKSNLRAEQCIYVIDVDIWGPGAVEMVLEDRVKKHQENLERYKNGGTLDYCTDEERWFNPKSKKYLRCEKFCPVNQFCEQYNTNLVPSPF